MSILLKMVECIVTARDDMKGKKMIIIMASMLAIISIFVVAGISFKRRNSNYIDSTETFRTLYKQNGDSLDGNISKNELKSRHGSFAPDYDVSELVMENAGIEYVYAGSDTDDMINGKLIYVVIKSDEYVFGNENVHVGSTKKDIEEIFKNSKRPDPDKGKIAFYDEGGNEISTYAEEYCDDDYLLTVGFVYDDNENVKVIYIGPGPNN